MKKTLMLIAAAAAVLLAPLANAYAHISNPPDYLEQYAQYVAEHPELTVYERRLVLELKLYEENYINADVVKDPKNLCVYLSKHFALPEGYEPRALVAVNEAYAMPGVTLRLDCYVAFLKMARAMGKDGLCAFIKSGYRINKPNDDPFDMWNAWPGHSEHQTGLAFDLRLKDRTHTLLRNYEYEKTAEYAWLMQNAHTYGFILSYPEGKEAITGFYFEPWHWRYVGVTTATDMKEKGYLTFPEYWVDCLQIDDSTEIFSYTVPMRPFPDLCGHFYAEER